MIIIMNIYLRFSSCKKEEEEEEEEEEKEKTSCDYEKDFDTSPSYQEDQCGKRQEVKPKHSVF